MSNTIAIESTGNVLVIRFTRPEIRNPLSIEVLELLDRIVDDALTAESVKKIVFTGTGNVFASGADLREISKLTQENAKEFAFRGQRLMNKIDGLSKPTVAAINGFCFGGALDLALACSNRIASRTATFCHPGTGLGIITGWGGTQRLARLVGQANALKMFFTAEPIDAGEALRIGLVDRLTENPLGDSVFTVKR